ncbi:hypothetical protein BAUCODRAFT_128980 [Baudoinia panamericana UAMH 10762]|uniref:Uncharacterized protein n=1 Tax=Baudoinia panamericana (strain UAMH 10762) TaxID=717646 RepID=M2MPG2_BAUPA|nr:uncharacterized protein BAUCODRAFT_128980 [Baudoinia panamericana UAMH 10762]EMC98626.1 hypothetical protein BAUCODRAFT_128980 [Baudoinia panamericana UAMH 10762]
MKSGKRRWRVFLHNLNHDRKMSEHHHLHETSQIRTSLQAASRTHRRLWACGVERDRSRLLGIQKLVQGRLACKSTTRDPAVGSGPATTHVCGSKRARVPSPSWYGKVGDGILRDNDTCFPKCRDTSGALQVNAANMEQPRGVDVQYVLD